MCVCVMCVCVCVCLLCVGVCVCVCVCVQEPKQLHRHDVRAPKAILPTFRSEFDQNAAWRDWRDSDEGEAWTINIHHEDECKHITAHECSSLEQPANQQQAIHQHSNTSRLVMMLDMRGVCADRTPNQFSNPTSHHPIRKNQSSRHNKAVIVHMIPSHDDVQL